MTRSGRKRKQPEREITMRSAIRKLHEILACAAALYKEITLSALRVVPGRD